ncbi:MAG: hypothetical protein R3E82_07100 [Pseudomonadales bacterium]|nr:hypothetical protein [Pseudomonadales bacterium]
MQAGAALLGLGSIAWWQRNETTRWALTRCRNEELQLTASPDVDEDLCLLTPEQIEGPFFIPSSVRRQRLPEASSASRPFFPMSWSGTSTPPMRTISLIGSVKIGIA